jgi:hypothetical protein
MFVFGSLFAFISLAMVTGFANSRNPNVDMFKILMLLAALSCAVFGFGAAIAALRNQRASFRSHGLGFLISLLGFALPIFLSRIA